jgi:small conductance mechanosensitive channel
MIMEENKTPEKETPISDRDIYRERREERRAAWKNATPMQKAQLFISSFFFLICIGLLLMLIYSRNIFGNEVGDAVLGEGIPNGWVALGNAMSSSSGAWLATLITIIACFSISFVLTTLIKLLTRGGRRSRTVGSLIRSLIHYITVIVGLAVILAVWGVDVSAIVAGVGVLTLIIGLGCQTLIQDVISGIFIVFDDFYSVGDTVIIDGFRGEVKAIGLKSTKLIDFGGNIKSINNSAINTVVNLSRYPSAVSVTMNASYNEDVERVEAVIQAALPELKKKIPAITEGPYYKGISGFNEGGVSYMLLCKCLEGDRFQVTRDLNREFFLLFVNNDIIVPYNQITINEADPKNRPSANPEQRSAVNEAIKKNRAPKKNTKKKTRAERALSVIGKAAGALTDDD